MKFLEAKALAKKQGITPQPRGGKGKIIEENKMQPGSRPDQSQIPPKNTTPTHKPEVVSLAKELGVDLNTVTGTGQNGAVLIRDVRNAKEAADLAEEEKISGTQD